LIAFEKQLEARGDWLLADQRAELYNKLVRKVWDAALATEMELKKITRDERHAPLILLCNRLHQEARRWQTRCELQLGLIGQAMVRRQLSRRTHRRGNQGRDTNVGEANYFEQFHTALWESL
jgi:hypothetical protein